MTEVRPLMLCKTHFIALAEAAHGCGCYSQQSILDFIADCMEGSNLYDAALALHGEAIVGDCVLCMFLFDPVPEAVAGALSLRARDGLRREHLS